MNQIKYKNSLYDIVDIICIKNTYHFIIMKEDKISYINKIGSKYYPPLIDFKTDANDNKYLEYLRKQYLLQCLVDYIKDNEMYENINNVTEAFKEYIKTSLVETFMYWPYMSDIEFDKEIKIIKKDLEAFLNKKLYNRLLAPDNETIILVDNFKLYKKEVEDENLVPDPSFKKQK